MIYVKVSEKNAPYIDLISFDPQEGFEAKEDLPPEQMTTLINFTNKCWIDKDGNIQVSNDKLITDAEKQNAQLQMQLKMFQNQFSSLVLAIAKGGAK